jgi:hypothetical protein
MRGAVLLLVAALVPALGAAQTPQQAVPAEQPKA